MARLLIILGLIFSTSLPKQLNAQVTIGSKQKPAPGALLDLKEEDKTTKGLALPRVKLTNLKPTTPLAFASSIGGSGEWEMDKHIGLVVYNVNEGTGQCIGDSYALENIPWEGIHIWDGEIWKLIREKTPTNETDVRSIVYHEVRQIDGIPVGSFTMSYKDEEETYYYASFGSAGIWMTQSLRTQYTPQGIKLVMDGVQTDAGKEAGTSKLKKSGAYPSSQDVANPSDYNLNRSSGKEVGLLYDWYTATDHHNCSIVNQNQENPLSNPTLGALEVETKELNTFIRGICPEGWHIPSDREWNQFEKYLTENASRYTQTPSTSDGLWNEAEEGRKSFSSNNSGIVMKSKTNVENKTETTDGNSKTAQNGGFEAYLTGAKVNTGTTPTAYYGLVGYFWSSSSYSTLEAWYRAVAGSNRGTFRTTTARKNFFSVRCKKDE